MWIGVNENTKFALVAPVNKDANPLTNWNNNFSWAYMLGGEDANPFDTKTKELGGKTDSYFRATLLWNDEDTPNLSDMDLHIGFGNARNSDVYYSNKNKNGFELDVDIINPEGIAVENITTDQVSFMKQTFTVSVHTYSKNHPAKGFKVQIKIGDEYLYYHFNKEVTSKKYYPILKFKNGEIVEEYMQPVNSVDNNHLEKVVTVFNSPNYWVQGGNNKGNKHLMFAIDNFTPESKFLGIIPEHLATHLQPHRRVFDTISSNLMVEPTQNAVAGVGKSYTNKKITIPVILKTNRGYISYLIK